MNKKKTLIIVIAAAVVLTAVLLVLIFLPKGDGSQSGDDSLAATSDEAADIELSTDSGGVHQAVIGKKKDGSLGGYGTLMEYYPADISTIHLENDKGTLDITAQTPEGEATVYTLKGYENLEMQSSTPDLIANALASLSFTQVVSNDKSRASTYGFDKPGAVATVTYTDGTSCVITVGDDAPQAKGTYVKFGSGDEIYLCDTETVKVLRYGVTDVISLTINTTPEDSDNMTPSSITLSGSAFPDEIELVPYTGTKTSSSYLMKKPSECFAGENSSSLVEGAIRGLYADSVKMVNPTNSQLDAAGLYKPYARLRAVYPDETVELLASKPDGDNNVNLIVSGGSVVYTLSADKLPWVTMTYSDLVGEYVLCPKLTSLSGVSVYNGDRTYDFTLNSRVSKTTDNDGNETESTVTTVYWDKEELQIEKFSTYFDAVSMIELADTDVETKSGKPVFTVTYTFSEDKSQDKLEFYESDGNRYVAVLNGKVAGHSHKADIVRAINGLAELFA